MFGVCTPGCENGGAIGPGLAPNLTAPFDSFRFEQGLRLLRCIGDDAAPPCSTRADLGWLRTVLHDTAGGGACAPAHNTFLNNRFAKGSMPWVVCGDIHNASRYTMACTRHKGLAPPAITAWGSKAEGNTFFTTSVPNATAACHPLVPAPSSAIRSVYNGSSLSSALSALNTSARGARSDADADGPSVLASVCPLTEMVRSAGNLTIARRQALSISGAETASLALLPRLWGRFMIQKTAALYLAAVEFREQATWPQAKAVGGSGRDLLGAAVMCRGSLYAYAVAFRQLSTTIAGGAVFVDSGGLVRLERCLFGGCRATNGCGPPFDAAGTHIISHCLLPFAKPTPVAP